MGRRGAQAHEMFKQKVKAGSRPIQISLGDTDSSGDEDEQGTMTAAGHGARDLGEN